MAHVLTGTWEEIKTHDAELAGRQMKVIVDGDEPKRTQEEMTRRLEAFDAWIAAPRPKGIVLLDDSRASIYAEE